MMDDAQALVRDSVELASLPAVVHRAMELLNNPNTSASEIGQVIDSVLAAHQNEVEEYRAGKAKLLGFSPSLIKQPSLLIVLIFEIYNNLSI